MEKPNVSALPLKYTRCTLGGECLGVYREGTLRGYTPAARALIGPRTPDLYQSLTHQSLTLPATQCHLVAMYGFHEYPTAFSVHLKWFWGLGGGSPGVPRGKGFHINCSMSIENVLTEADGVYMCVYVCRSIIPRAVPPHICFDDLAEVSTGCALYLPLEVLVHMCMSPSPWQLLQRHPDYMSCDELLFSK